MVKTTKYLWIVTCNFLQWQECSKTIKEYEYLLNEKQSTLDNYIKYLSTLAISYAVSKVHVIEIVRNKNKKIETITNLFD